MSTKNQINKIVTRFYVEIRKRNTAPISCEKRTTLITPFFRDAKPALKSPAPQDMAELRP